MVNSSAPERSDGIRQAFWARRGSGLNNPAGSVAETGTNVLEQGL